MDPAHKRWMDWARARKAAPASREGTDSTDNHRANDSDALLAANLAAVRRTAATQEDDGEMLLMMG